MDQSTRHAIEFLKKELKTYSALSLFLSKRGIKADAQVGKNEVLIGPVFYTARIKEAKKLVHELQRTR
ncbi:MAG: hypothetical protein ACYDCG_16610 [Candidatus Acidiferrales bacterium]